MDLLFILQFPQPAMQTNPYLRISDMGCGPAARHFGREQFNCPHFCVPSVPDCPPSCTHSPPQPSSGVHGTFSMASLFNIIICVIQHLPFIYFYLFFWLGNLGSSPDRLCRNLFPHALLQPARPLPPIPVTRVLHHFSDDCMGHRCPPHHKRTDTPPPDT